MSAITIFGMIRTLPSPEMEFEMDNRSEIKLLSDENDQAIRRLIHSLGHDQSSESQLYRILAHNPDLINYRFASISFEPPVLHYLSALAEGRIFLQKHFRFISAATAETLNYIHVDGISTLFLLFTCYNPILFSDVNVRNKITPKVFNARNMQFLSPASLLIDPPVEEDEHFTVKCHYINTIDLFVVYPEFAALLSTTTLTTYPYRKNNTMGEFPLLWYFINKHSNGIEVLSQSKLLRDKISRETLDKATAESLVDCYDGQEFLLRFSRIQALAARHVSLAPSKEVSSTGRYHLNFASTQTGREFIARATEFRKRLTTNDLKANLQFFGTDSLAYFLLATSEGRAILHVDDELRNKFDSGILNMEFKTLGLSYTSLFFINPAKRDAEKTCDSILIQLFSDPDGVAFVEAHLELCRLITKRGLKTVMEAGPHQGHSPIQLLQSKKIFKELVMQFSLQHNMMRDLTNLHNWAPEPQPALQRRRI